MNIYQLAPEMLTCLNFVARAIDTYLLSNFTRTEQLKTDLIMSVGNVLNKEVKNVMNG